MQKYYFFLNQKSIIFVNSISDIEFNVNESIHIIDYKNDIQLEIQWFLNDLSHSGWIILCGNYLDVAVNHFKKSFKMIKAGGGLVESPDGSLLFIFRNGKWDLPKGKKEKGEKMIITAVREVEEECGINKLSVVHKLSNTYHIYLLNDMYVLKQTHWYKMKAEKKQNLIPQLEEGITKVEWIDKNTIKTVLNNTFPSIQWLIENYYPKMLS